MSDENLQQGSDPFPVNRNFSTRESSPGGNPTEVDLDRSAAAIAELQQLKQELQFREQQLHLALESAGMTAFTWDLRSDRVEQLVNPRSSEAADQPICTLLDKLQYIHPADRDRYEAALTEALYQTGQLEVEHRQILADGSIVWLMDKARVIYNAADEPVQLIGVATDITERKQVEQTLQNREDKLKSFIDANVIGILFGDLQGRILDANDELLKIVGYTREDLRSGKLQWDKITPPEYSSLDALYIAEATEKGACTPYEKEYIRKDGTRVPVLVGYSLVGEARQESVAFILDLTARKQTEESLKTTLQRLTLHIQNTPLAVIEWNRKMQIERWSQEAERIFGWRSEEVLGKAWADLGGFVHPEDAPQVYAAVQELVNGQRSRNTNCNRNYRKDGSVIYCEWYDSAIVDESGNLESLLSLVLDISERKRIEDERMKVEAERQEAEAELREKQRFIQQIADTTPEIIYVHDLLLRSNVYINRQVWTLLGYTPEEIQAMGANVLPNLIHPEDLRELENHLAKLAALQEDEVVDWEYRMQHANGEWRWFLGRETLFRRTPDGKAQQVLGIIRDVTDRKLAEVALQQSEFHYRYLAESIPQLVWTANPLGGLIDVNQRWLDYTGLTLDQTQGDGWTTAVHPDDLPDLLQQWTIACEQATLYRAECRMRRQDGLYRWHLVQAVPLKNEQNQIIKWFGTSTDIEDQKQIEQQRTRLLDMERIARSKAEEANRIKDEFLRVLSHELRTPLNPILGWSKLLKSGRLSAEQAQRAIVTIERNAKIQLQLVNDLIDMSEILRGKLDLTLQPIDLIPVIQQAIDRVKFAADAKSIRLQFHPTPAVCHTLGDAARLQQAIWNLLNNAVKFTPEGGRVEVKLESMSAPASPTAHSPLPTPHSPIHSSTHPPLYAHITITDTGKGIHPDFLPHLFEYFRQQDGSTTRQFGGLGMGLAIVRHIVEMHGGTVLVSSPGEHQGATFTVRLPLP
ncbi:PAS domain-containing sensor histidine kinase [Leptolyngbya ohadii]|uniref:PAS domain-containing sensor histidine kinase n=1 Tax=Leptolyngbya ohadii TaxID=1962290 RepID=UPI000B5A04DE|nr:PAS domain S-box protein [Leptolyngbya ohadii]